MCVCCLGVVHAPVQFTCRTLPPFHVHQSSQRRCMLWREGNWRRNGGANDFSLCMGDAHTSTTSPIPNFCASLDTARLHLLSMQALFPCVLVPCFVRHNSFKQAICEFCIVVGGGEGHSSCNVWGYPFGWPLQS